MVGNGESRNPRKLLVLKIKNRLLYKLNHLCCIVQFFELTQLRKLLYILQAPCGCRNFEQLRTSSNFTGGNGKAVFKLSLENSKFSIQTSVNSHSSTGLVSSGTLSSFHKKIKVRAVKCTYSHLNNQMLSQSRCRVDKTIVGVLAYKRNEGLSFCKGVVVESKPGKKGSPKQSETEMKKLVGI